MSRISMRTFLLLAASLFIAFLLVDFAFVNAQVKGKGKPPQYTCDGDLICEEGEFVKDVAYSSQPCLDCVPKEYGPLDTTPAQVIGKSSQYGEKLFQFRYIDGTYIDTWASQELAKGLYQDIGDIESDGQQEIVAVAQFSLKQKKTTYYQQKIFVFKNGSDGSVDYESPYLGLSEKPCRDLLMADADNDGFDDELILLKADWLEIYRWNGSAFINVWISPRYGETIWTVSVGDADADGQNEIVCAMFGLGYAMILEHLGNGSWGNETYTEYIPGVIDWAVPCDADNDGLSEEIIAGGANNRLMIWKRIDGEYRTILISDDLGGFTQAVNCGDVDGDGDNEIVVGATTPAQTLYVFKLVRKQTPPGYDLQLLASSYVGHGFAEIWTADTDYDGSDEILTGTEVYDFDGEICRTFSSFYMGDPRAK